MYLLTLRAIFVFNLMTSFCLLPLHPASAETKKDAAQLAAEGLRLYRTGDYERAAALTEEAVRLFERKLGRTHPIVGGKLLNLGRINRAMHRTSEAEKLFKRSLAIFERTLGALHGDVGQTLVELSELYAQLNRDKEAEDSLVRAVSILKAAPPDYRPVYGLALSELGQQYAKKKQHQKAETVFNQAMEVLTHTTGPDTPEVDAVLNNLAGIFSATKRYHEAEIALKRSVEIREKAAGKQSREVGLILFKLADLHQHQAQYEAAKPILERTIKIAEATSGPNHPDVAAVLGALGKASKELGDFGAAETAFRRALNIIEASTTPDSLELAEPISNLAGIRNAMGDYEGAVELYTRVLKIRAQSQGDNSGDVATALNNLATAELALSKYEQAEKRLRRVVEIEEALHGKDSFLVSTSISNLGHALSLSGQFREAQKYFQRGFELRYAEWGWQHPAVAKSLHDLGESFLGLGDFREAERQLRKALEIREGLLGVDHPDVGKSLRALADLYRVMGRFDQAEPLYARAVSICEAKLGSAHTDLSQNLSRLALLYLQQSRHAESEALLERALSIYSSSIGEESPETVSILALLGRVYTETGRFTEAFSILNRAVALSESKLGLDHHGTSLALCELANARKRSGSWEAARETYQRCSLISLKAYGDMSVEAAVALDGWATSIAASGDWEGALKQWRAGTNILKARLTRGLASVAKSSAHWEVKKLSRLFRGDIRAAYHATSSRPDQRQAALFEAFDNAQWGLQSDAADAFRHWGERSAVASQELKASVRERQDLMSEWSDNEAVLLRAKSLPAEQRDAQREKILVTRQAAIDDRLSEIDRILGGTPQNPLQSAIQVSSVDEARKALSNNEALILFWDADALFGSQTEETFIWVVTKTDVRWARSELGTEALTELVQALRCGLDEEEWSTPTKAAKCGERLGTGELPSASSPLPFDLAKAHHLYKSLFGEVEDLIRGKRLLIVPSGPLTTLPFHALVTKAPAEARPRTFDGYRKVAWLAREHAITILPAVSSLKALRGTSSQVLRAERDYAGYGNPVLEGDNTTCRTIKVPDECPAAGSVVAEAGERATVRGRGSRRNAGIDALASRGGNVAETLTRVRALCPLPDTAYEINCTARGFSQASSLIRLDQQATEADLKAENEAGNLARYRVVHFATHGLLSSDVAQMRLGAAEPALVLTPPSGTPKDSEDDGLLTASEVAGLKLNADWVVLSACNTAASDGSGTEALSGLAKAFIYAGARALLVSHWPVYSDAAVRLTTSAFGKLERDPSIGRSEAMRQAMVELIDDTSQVDNAHPAVWAPFIVVGEGGQ